MLYCNAGAAAFQYGGGMVENDVCETEELLLGPLLLVWLRRGFRGRDAAVHGMPRQAYAGIGGGGSGGDRLLNAQEMKEAEMCIRDSSDRLPGVGSAARGTGGGCLRRSRGQELHIGPVDGKSRRSAGRGSVRRQVRGRCV